MKLIIIAAVAALSLSAAANASDMGVINLTDGVKVTLTDEPCKMQNFPGAHGNRAVYFNQNAVIEGCYQVSPPLRAVLVLFDDSDLAVYSFNNIDVTDVEKGGA